MSVASLDFQGRFHYVCEDVGCRGRMDAARCSAEERERLETEAVGLVVRLTSGEATEADAQVVASWCSQSPAHEQAFHKARRLWTGMGGLGRDLIGEVGLPVAPPEHAFERAAAVGQGARDRRRRPWASWGAAAAAVAAVVIGVIGQMGGVTRLTADFSTGIGEQTTATLADGSVVQLNTKAALAVRYSDVMREVELLEGEAAFRVEKDSARPFIVRTKNGQVRAVGTEFLVNTQADASLVTVVEGVVEVRASKDGSVEVSPVLVEAGQHIHYSRRSGIGAVAKADLRIATAWQRGKLIFESEALSRVIEEINRYRPGRVFLLNSALSPHPVSGVFDLDRLDSAVGTIEQTLPVDTVRLAGRFVLFY